MGLIKNKKISEIAPVMLGGVAYSVTGIQLVFEDGNNLGLIFFFVALINFLILAFFRKRSKQLNVSVNLLNACAAFFSAYVFYLQGSNDIPYAYLIVGILFLTAAVFIYKGKKLFRRT